MAQSSGSVSSSSARMRVLEGALARLRRRWRPGAARASRSSSVTAGLHVFGADAVERNAELNVKKRVGVARYSDITFSVTGGRTGVRRRACRKLQNELP